MHNADDVGKLLRRALNEDPAQSSETKRQLDGPNAEEALSLVDRLDLEVAMRHLHKKYQTALRLYAMGYSKRHVARLMNSKELAMLVLRAERALLEELNRWEEAA